MQNVEKTTESVKPWARMPTWRYRPVQRAITAVAREYGIGRRAISERSRCRLYTERRFLAFWLAHKLGASTTHIGHHCGGYDHATVLNGMRRVERARVDPDYRTFSDRLLAELEGKE